MLAILVCRCNINKEVKLEHKHKGMVKYCFRNICKMGGYPQLSSGINKLSGIQQHNHTKVR